MSHLDAEAAYRILSLLEGVATKLGIDVRYESLATGGEDIAASRGGYCRVRGKQIILVEARLGPVERGAVLAQALSGADLSRVFIPPAARQAIEQSRNG